MGVFGAVAGPSAQANPSLGPAIAMPDATLGTGVQIDEGACSGSAVSQWPRRWSSLGRALIPAALNGRCPFCRRPRRWNLSSDGGLFGLPASPGGQSPSTVARTSPSAASLDCGAGPSSSVDTGPLFASGHHDREGTELDDQFGHYVQSNNTIIPPVQSQGLRTDVALPTAAPAAPAPGKTHQRAKTESGLEDPFPAVPFKESERGIACKERGLTCDQPGPVECFVCVAHRKRPAGGFRQWADWKSFQNHVSRCSPLESMKPCCHFCGEPQAAYGRPQQMERHLVGYGGNAPCKVLAKLVADGTKTHGALAEWLVKEGKDIEPKFLGSRLAVAFYRAWEHGHAKDVAADLTPQHRTPKGDGETTKRKMQDSEETEKLESKKRKLK